jgi:hypothetical protein
VTGLIETFASLARPSAPGSYTVGPEVGRCRVGRSFDGYPALLVSFSNLNGAHLVRKLANFAYHPPAPVHVRSGDQTTNDDLAIVECCTNERRLAKYFFRIGTEVLAPEAELGEEARFERAVDAVVTLFKALQRPASKTVQGLWAELAIIALAHKPEVALKAWHSIPSSLHDFVNGRSRLEVKSTIREMREHRFHLDQLRLADDEGIVLVASVLLQEAAGGLSLFDLVTAIKQKLTTDESKRRLETIVADSLGSSLVDVEDQMFDFDAARSSLLFYRAQDVPACEPGSPEVKEVTFTSDLSAVNPTPLGVARSISTEFGDLLPVGPDVRVVRPEL